MSGVALEPGASAEVGKLELVGVQVVVELGVAARHGDRADVFQRRGLFGVAVLGCSGFSGVSGVSWVGAGWLSEVQVWRLPVGAVGVACTAVAGAAARSALLVFQGAFSSG